MIPEARDECPDPALTSREETVAWLLRAAPERAAPLIVRTWDQPEWEHVWRLYIAALADDTERRQQLHDIATISFLPVSDQFPSYCNLIRLKWAGYDGAWRCDAEEEIIDWAAEVIRLCEDEAVVFRIVCTLNAWERPLENQLATALQSLCEMSVGADIRKAAIKALATRKTAESGFMEQQGADDQAHARSPQAIDTESCATPKPAPLPSRRETQKIVIPRPDGAFDLKTQKPTYDKSQPDCETGQ